MTIRQQIDGGRQVYIIYPLVEESEEIKLMSAEDRFAALKPTFGANSMVGIKPFAPSLDTLGRGLVAVVSLARIDGAFSVAGGSGRRYRCGSPGSCSARCRGSRRARSGCTCPPKRMSFGPLAGSAATLTAETPAPESEGWFDRPMRWAQLTLVEDDPGVQRLMVRALAPEYQVEIAADELDVILGRGDLNARKHRERAAPGRGGKPGGAGAAAVRKGPRRR